MFSDESLGSYKTAASSVWDKTYSSIVLQRDFHDWLQEIPTLVTLQDSRNASLCLL
jgi:hypothetical protein